MFTFILLNYVWAGLFLFVNYAWSSAKWLSRLSAPSNYLVWTRYLLWYTILLFLQFWSNIFYMPSNTRLFCV